MERPDWLQGLIVPIAVVFDVKAEGTHTFELMIDNSSASVPLHVILGAPPEAPGPQVT